LDNLKELKLSDEKSLAINSLKIYIRQTLHFETDRAVRPFILLRGKDAMHDFCLGENTEEIFGWGVNSAEIIVHRNASRKIEGYGWRCECIGISEGFRELLSSVGYGSTFTLLWGSDKRIIGRHRQGPVVDILKTEFQIEFEGLEGSHHPNWQGFRDGVEGLSVLAKLRI